MHKSNAIEMKNAASFFAEPKKKKNIALKSFDQISIHH
jgi:hypothetical protein